jgi:hypothetical protein
LASAAPQRVTMREFPELGIDICQAELSTGRGHPLAARHQDQPDNRPPAVPAGPLRELLAVGTSVGSPPEFICGLHDAYFDHVNSAPARPHILIGEGGGQHCRADRQAPRRALKAGPVAFRGMYLHILSTPTETRLPDSIGF